MSSSKHLLVRLAAMTGLMGVIALDTNAVADTLYFDNGGSGSDWSTPANWTGDTEPTADDTARVGDPGAANPASVTISQSGEACDLLILGTRYAEGEVTMYGGDLTASNRLNIADTGTGSFDQRDGTVTGYIEMVRHGGNGTYRISGGELNIPGLYTGPGTASIEQSGGTIYCTGNEQYGRGDNSSVSTTVTHTGGTHVVEGRIELNYEGATPVSYTMSGTATRLEAGSLVVGNKYMNGSTSTFTQNDGTVIAETVVLASWWESEGTYNLKGGTLETGALKKGYGDGTFNWSGGTLAADTISALAQVTNDGGTLSPGGTGTVGTTTFTGSMDYAQNTSGTLYIDIASPWSFDQVLMDPDSGDAVLNGTLYVNMLSTTGVAGTYDILTGLDITNNLVLNSNIDKSWFSLDVIEGNSETLKLTCFLPEPSTVLLLLLPAAGLALRRVHA